MTPKENETKGEKGWRAGEQGPGLRAPENPRPAALEWRPEGQGEAATSFCVCLARGAHIQAQQKTHRHVGAAEQTSNFHAAKTITGLFLGKTDCV